MKRALIVVDVQNDFLPGGALAVPGGDAVIGPINRLLELPFDLILATRDYHPAGHASFASTSGKRPGERTIVRGVEQILWPDHCVQGTPGAELAPGLHAERCHQIVYKGVDPVVDSYSAFFDNRHDRATGLDGLLRERGIEQLYIVGLATDYCVLYSVRDALELGYLPIVVTDGCKGIDLVPGDVARALEEMHNGGATLMTADEVCRAF